MMICALSIYAVIATPLDVAFELDTRIYDLFFDAAFVVDVYFNFRTTFPTKAKDEESRPTVIATTYLCGWFAIDAFSAIPFIAFLPQGGTSYVYLALCFSRAFRIFHIRKLVGVLLESSGGRILRLVIFFVLCAHWVGGLFFLLGRVQDPTIYGGVWIDEWGVRALPSSMQYVASLYWALATLSTVGYGDITAVNWKERLFTAATMVLGSVLYASIFGILATTIQNFDKAKVIFQDKMQSVRDFCKWNALPAFVQDRLCEYVEHDWVMNQRGTGGEFALCSPASCKVRNNDVYVSRFVTKGTNVFKMKPTIS